MSWGHPKKGRAGRMVSAVAVALVAASIAPAGEAVAGPSARVIVREAPGSGRAPEKAVKALGGRIGRRLPIIDGFVAELPREAVPMLAADADVLSVTPDARVRLQTDALDPEDADDESYDPSKDPGSMYTLVHKVTRAGKYWRSGYTGVGVDVAMIDSGVVPVDGMTAAGKVVNGADLSFESQAPALRYLDTFGHGTHMAGIIAGRDDAVTAATKQQHRDRFMGMAPGARIVSVKVADAMGATDVSQVIAAIDWVVQHRRDNGMNIRVLNLSFGTDGVQSYLLDPLTYAAEVAWRKGIVVVVAAGNESFGSGRLNNPAYDPYVIAVGAADAGGTYGKGDDSVLDFSSCGSATRRTDLVAPGKSVISLRDPGSHIDQTSPQGRVGERLFRGSGTSQAAAIVSGAAALLVQQRPSITPDQVKALLVSTASPVPPATDSCQGAGMLDLNRTLHVPTPAAVQTWPPATGLGSLELARGTAHLTDGTTPLEGEIDIFGSPWDGKSWSVASWNETSWSGGTWNGKSWSGDTWSATSWAGKSWSTTDWTGTSWSGKSWSDASWTGKSWSGKSWGTDVWSGKSWSGKSWGGDAWSTIAWGP
ncbi:MAG: S8 family serine peptidase [Actinomycetota bacterium]